MDRSLRRLGQLLVVMGALLGAVLGVGLALLVESTGTSGTVAAPERVAVLTASPSSSQPPGLRAASTPDPGNGNIGSDGQRVQAAGQRKDKADKEEGRRDKPGKAKGKDKPGKGKDK